MPPLPDFTYAAVAESDLPGDPPFTITLHAGGTGETWTLGLEVARGLAFRDYVAQRRALGLPYERLAVENLLRGGAP